MIPIAPRLTINVAITFNRTWPATILANSLTERVIGRIINENSSIRKMNGAIKIGMPDGRNMLIKPLIPLR